MSRSIKIIAVFILMIGSYANAQIIVKGGLTVHNTTIKNIGTNAVAQTTAAKAGFHLGGAYELYLSDVISLQPGLQFSLRPFSIVENNTTNQVNVFMLEIPLVMKTYFMETGSIRLYGLSGAYLGFNLSTKINGIKRTLGNNLDNYQKPFDMGLVLGTGIEINESLLISISYEPGLANLTPAPQVAQWNLKEKNRALRLSFAYKFN